MRINLPKNNDFFKSVKFEEIMEVELNNTKIEKIIAPLFHRMVGRGRAFTPLSKKRLKTVEELVDALIHEPEFSSFADPKKKKMLLGWVLANQIELKKFGKKKQYDQLSHMKPINVAIYRSGLPIESGERRKADKVVYKSMLRAWSKDFPNDSKEQIRDIAMMRLGTGINIESPDEMNPEWNKQSRIDINQFVALKFLSVFPVVNRSERDLDEDGASNDAIPGSVSGIGDDLYRLFYAYRGVSSTDMIEMVLAITSFRLYQIPLRVEIALTDLLRGFDAVDVSQDFGPNPHRIFCDFTASEGLSQNLAKACALRDIEKQQTMLYARTVIRSLDIAIKTWRRPEFESKRAVDKLQLRIDMINDPDVQSSAANLVGDVRDYLIETIGENSEEVAYIDELGRREKNSVTLLARIVFEAQQIDTIPSQMKWMWGIGGLQFRDERQPFALLDGTTSNRQSWRYQPTDSLLATMICICMTRRAVENDFADDSETKLVFNSIDSIPLSELLDALEERFGVLVNKVPEGFDSPENQLAAQQNMIAFTARLKQLGCFEGLSDDTLSQPVSNPKKVLTRG
jgi:hypothetical protein